jgi:ketosteroid isomerase-like protein
MKRIIPLFLILSMCGLVFGDTASEITQLLKAQDEAWNRGDLDGFVAPYDASGELVFMSSVIIRDPKDLKERYEKRYKDGQADFGKLTFSDLQVEELAPGLARAWGKWSVAQKDKTSSGYFTLILQKRNGQWRIIHDHSS